MTLEVDAGLRARWPLFEDYPALAEALAPVALCTLPTPVEPLPALSPHAWIKRDDLTATAYGGNKMRKLEVIVPEIRRRRARRIVTFGATGTNAGVAASLVAAELGVACTVLTFPQPASATVDKNAAAMRKYGADVVRAGSLLSTALAWYAHPRRLDPRTYFLFAGCSNPVAVFAYVNAAFELRAQIRVGACPAPKEIVVAAGTAATLAGLTLGCALAGLDTRVVGVRVAPARVGPFSSCTVDVAAKMMRACAARIERVTGRAPGPAPAPVLLDAFFGDGYGVATDAGLDAVATLARVTRAPAGAPAGTPAGAPGIPLEQTYTGKAFAAFLARLAADPASDRLFWNTFSSR